MASDFIDDTPEGTGIYTTSIPGFEDAADIQAALKIYHYGSETIPQNNQSINAKSIAGHLHLIRTDLDAEINRGIGSQISDEAPSEPLDGFIWVDADASIPNLPTYLSAIYSNEPPTESLVDGVIWVDKNANPVRAYVYDSVLSNWVSITEIPGIVDQAGDIIYASGADDIERLPIGENGTFLKVVSGLPSWSALPEKIWVLKGSGSLIGSSLSINSINGERLFVVLKDWSHDSEIEDVAFTLRFNSDSGPNYVNTGGLLSASGLASPNFPSGGSYDMTVSVDLANSESSLKPVSTIANIEPGSYFGYYKSPNPITSIQLDLPVGVSFDLGSYEIWSYE